VEIGDTPSPGTIRPIDITRDLAPLADLLHEAFKGRLDADGLRALRQMRRMARNRRAQRQVLARGEVPGLPYYGYVWEVNGRLVGNVTLIPIRHKGQRLYLVVNVAVAPAYRRRGIARALMLRAEQHARERHAQALWLQVDEDNEGAVWLYEGLGFEKHSVVTLWRSDATPADAPLAVPSPRVRVRKKLTPRPLWDLERAWLAEAYPPELGWHHLLPSWELLAPTAVGLWRRLKSGIWALHWRALRGGDLVGAVALLPRNYAASDEAALALPADPAPDEVAALLQPLLRRGRPIRAEYPRGRAADALRSAGLWHTRDLRWMVKSLRG